MRWPPLVFLILLMPSPLRSDSASVLHPADSAAIEQAPAVSDTVVSPRVPFRVAAASEVGTLPKGFHQTKSPGLALLLSALLPGAGQVYNESYWKVPIILGLGIYFTSSWLDQNRRYHDARDNYARSLLTNPPVGDPRELTRREFYKDQRDTFTWYFAILYMLNLADAFVDASLYDFNVGSDLSIRLMPSPGSAMQLQIIF